MGSAFVSMWVSNTATSLMMLPIALSVVQLLPDQTKQTREMRSSSNEGFRSSGLAESSPAPEIVKLLPRHSVVTTRRRPHHSHKHF